jgi:hypothetical protein
LKISKGIRVIAICWLLFLAAFLLGIYTYDKRLWPYLLIQKIEKFFSADSSQNVSLSEKILNDMDFKPTRQLVDSDARISVTGEHRELAGLPINPRRENPRIFLSNEAPRGYRLIYGVFDFRDTRCGVIMLDPNGNLVHVWHVSQEDLDWEHRPDANVYPHGFEISSDGSILVAFDEGSSLTKYDYCGKVVWRIEGRYHHSIDFEDEKFFWAMGRPGEIVVKIDQDSGTILKKIDIMKVIEANPDIDIFGIRQMDNWDKVEWIWAGAGPFHGNDVEALPKDLEKFYPGFQAGDLLISLRSLNLIFVMDPDTLKVKWWRQGIVRRQHDPDWNNRGTITIFNNNMHRKWSNILEIDPKTFKTKILVDGRKYNFYSCVRGKHQLLPNGGILVTSSNQGKVFEVDEKGNIVFEFINTFDKNKNLLVSEAMFLPENYFKELPKCSR